MSMALDSKKFLARFVDESREHVLQLGEGLAALERDPGDPDNLHRIFRSLHTIKGASRMLSLTTISETAHRAEDLLSALRDASLAYSAALGRLLFQALDALAALVELVAQGAPLPAPDQALCAALALALDPQGTPAPAAVAAPAPPPAAEPAPLAKAPDTVRVRLAKLDGLLKLMGEVESCHQRARQRLADLHLLERAILARLDTPDQMPPAMRQFGAALREDFLAQDLLIDELHGSALQMRMLPLALVFDPLGRMLRELARTLGKEVDCVVSGADMELDRQIIDRLGEPVLHLLRNALDHGIEAPLQRLAAGKNGSGKISLAARREGAFVAIDVADDGCGIDADALREKAVQLGLLAREQAGALSHAQALDLIFLPGLSTSAIITDISGRGVGMDAVKRCIVDQLQGEISVDTQPGQGTAFTLRLPLSLAQMPVLLVTAGAIRFGFLAQSVQRLMRVPEHAFVSLASGRALALDGQFIALVSLGAILGIAARPGGDSLRAEHAGGRLLLLIKVRNEQLALLIDEIDDERDMVIKPLPAHMRAMGLVSGVVTTGNSELVSILHAPALFELARGARHEAGTQAAPAGAPVDARRILVVDDSTITRDIEKDVLEAHGYQVVLAEDGHDALGKAAAQRFDAVLTDVEMPNMDGFTLTERLREDARYRDTPIIIITSRANEEDKRRGVLVGANAYIVKGDFEQSNLLGILRNLLG
jgi:two-component system chemotaxis sensor kinase CheA